MQKQVHHSSLARHGCPPGTALPQLAQIDRARRYFFKYLTFLVLIFTSLTLNAQDLGLEWAKAFVGTASSSYNTTSVKKDASGNIYVGGKFEGTMDFDPGPGVFNMSGPAGAGTGFFVKLDPFGNFLWGRSIITSTVINTLGSTYLEVDPAGNVYATGVFGGITDMDPGAGTFNITAQGASDVYFLKLDTNGNFVFAHRMGSPTSGDYVNDMVIDPAGNIYVGGVVTGPGAAATYGPFSFTPASTQDGFVAKISPSGTFLNAQRIGGLGFDHVTSLETDAAGNLFVGVRVGAATTGIANLPGAGPTVLKLDGAGNLQWYYQQTDGLGVTSIAIGPGGEVYANPGSGLAVAANLVKLNADGTLAWTKRVGNTNTVATGDDGSLYVTGNYTAATAAMGSTTLPAPGGVPGFPASPGFIARMDASGNILMARPFTGEGTTYGSDMLVSNGDIFIAGYFSQTTDFDPSTCVYNLTSTGTFSYNGFVIKLTDDLLPDGVTVSPTTLAPLAQQTCILGIPSVIEGNVAVVTGPPGFNTTLAYQWQKAASASGPWENIEGEIFKDLQPLAASTSQYYRRLVTAKTTSCGVFAPVDTSAVAAVTVSGSVAPIASADGPQWFVCGPGSNTVALTGFATGGSGSGYNYTWFEGSTSAGTPLSTAAAWTSPAITQATTYTLKVTDGAGCVDIDQVTIVPAIANAGPDQSICQGAGGVQIGAAPVSSPAVTYAWTSISGDPVSSLSCTTCAQPIANPATASVYRLTVTVQQKDGSVCSSFDDITVTPVTAPNNTLTFAGSDQTVCKNSSVTLGGTADGTFAYTWTPGQYLSASQVANPIFNSGTAAVTNGSINYTVTAIKNGCAFTDEVKVYSLNSRISGQDEVICGPVWSNHLDEDNAPGTTYSWSVVSGDGVVLQTSAAGKNAYLKSNSGVTRFRRTTTLNGVTCTADALVQPCDGPGNCTFDILTLSEQGCPKVFGAAGLQLGTSMGNATDYNFSWSPANLVDNAHAASVHITSTAQATISVTITNKFDASITCTKSIVINPPTWSVPVFNAQDKNACAGVSVAIGDVANAGFTYAWTPANVLDNPAVSNPTATVAATTQFSVIVKETASGCVNRQTVTVTVAAPVAAAGNDRSVCNGSTVTLGSPAPSGTNWTYSWEPSNAAWTNGTGPTDAQPQVQFASATPQSFILTVTDPLSGCFDKDTVVLSNTVTAGEYAGAAIATCESAPVQIGRSAEPFAQYQWFMADGVTAATGLSCVTCANPTVTSPSATTTYVVKVSYPGCITPLSDQVTVTVNPVTGLELADKYVCPVGPIAIGYGAAGNPAAPAGATYLWAPATGLSCTTCANPTATVNTEATYSVTITLASGCSFTDEVKVTPTANAGADANLCPGESTIIGTPAIAGATYSWSGVGIVGASNVAQPTVKPTTTAVYTVSVTVDGCTTTDAVTVNVNTPADFSIAGNTAICQGGVATLSLVGSPAANTAWQWSPTAGVSNPTGTSTTVAATATTTYRLTQTNLVTGCSNYKEVIVVVSPNTIAATTGNLALCEGTSAALPLNVTSSGSYSYAWSPSVGLSNAFVASPTVTTGSPRTYTVTVTDNASQCQLVKQVNVAINAPEACFAPVTLTGNVFHDANALKDVTVNTTSANPIPTGLFVTLVDEDSAAVKTVPVNADGSYDFGVTAPGDYSIVLHQTSTGSTVPSLPAGWVNTGENLGAGVGSDDAVGGILTGVTVAGENVTNANFGVQQPPVTTGGTEPTQPNPGGATTVDLTSHFGLGDVDGNVSSITFTEFPENVATITVNGTTYVAPGTTPGSGQQVWPSGNLTVPATGLSVLVDPVDGGVEVEIPFFVTDNGGLESNVSTVTADFTVPGVSLSGNVFHDADALTDNTVNTTSAIAIPGGLFVTLVDNTGAAVATIPVNADGSYDFGDVQPGTYSVVLHQTATGSTVPSLPTGWNSTGEHLGANAGSDGAVNGILPAIVVTTTDVVNANFGVQQPPVADPKQYLIDQPPVDQIITLNGTHTSTGTGTTSPDQLTGSDPEDGTLNGSGKDRTVVITTLPDNGELYYNGILVIQGQVIPNYDPALTTIKLTGTGYTSTTFEYAYVDQAGEQSPPVPYTIRWEKPLPVTLVSFTATARENTTELVWVTSEETNSDRFEIQRSLNGKAWTAIGSVKAEGESKVRKTYDFVDQQAQIGNNLYRLKMIDMDGTFAFSSIRTVLIDGKELLMAYPNPASDRLLVRNYQQVRQAVLHNASGVKVFGSQKLSDQGIDLTRLPQGLYTLTITLFNGTITTHKVAVAR